MNSCDIHNYCNTCNPTPPANTMGSTPGTVTMLGTCTSAPPSLVMPAPYFTSRTVDAFGRINANSSPHECQPFDVVWNVCNAASTTSSATAYTVTFSENVPPGGNPGFNDTKAVSLPALAACACDTQTYSVSNGLYCADPAPTPHAINITTTVNSIYTGAFTIQP
jgi:hypothetical protein